MQISHPTCSTSPCCKSAQPGMEKGSWLESHILWGPGTWEKECRFVFLWRPPKEVLFLCLSTCFGQNSCPCNWSLPTCKMGQALNSLFKYPDILRIKTHREEMRLYPYRGNLLLIWLNHVCFPAVITKVCHENEHLPAFSEALSNQEVFLVTFG